MKKQYATGTALRMGLVMGLLALGIHDAEAQEQCLSGSTNQRSGDVNGFHYELWNPAGASSPTDESMPPGAGATFSGRWTNADDYLARRGFNYGSSGQTWRQRGGVKFTYTA